MHPVCTGCNASPQDPTPAPFRGRRRRPFRPSTTCRCRPPTQADGRVFSPCRRRRPGAPPGCWDRTTGTGHGRRGRGAGRRYEVSGAGRSGPHLPRAAAVPLLCKNVRISLYSQHTENQYPHSSLKASRKYNQI
jgi:hypothetical protein